MVTYFSRCTVFIRKKKKKDQVSALYIDRKHHNMLTLPADININALNIVKRLILAHKLAISCCSHQLAQWHRNSHSRLKLKVTPDILPALPERKISHTVKYCWNYFVILMRGQWSRDCKDWFFSIPREFCIYIHIPLYIYTVPNYIKFLNKLSYFQFKRFLTN